MIKKGENYLKRTQQLPIRTLDFYNYTATMYQAPPSQLFIGSGLKKASKFTVNCGDTHQHEPDPVCR